MALANVILTPRFCRTCRGIEPSVRFAPLTRTHCIGCQKAAKMVKAARRAPRASAKPARVRPGVNLPHLDWIRSLPCAVDRAGCGSKSHAHHVRLGTDGGTGLKPSDRWTVPLCAAHHLEIHNDGQRTFETRHGLNLRAMSISLYAASPHKRAEP